MGSRRPLKQGSRGKGRGFRVHLVRVYCKAKKDSGCNSFGHAALNHPRRMHTQTAAFEYTQALFRSRPWSCHCTSPTSDDQGVICGH